MSLARAALLRLKETGNLAWLLGEYGVRFVIEFLIGALIARRLGPAGFAPYALLFTLITLVIPFTDAGLNHLISRAVLTKEQTLDRILGTAAGPALPDLPHRHPGAGRPGPLLGRAVPAGWCGSRCWPACSTRSAASPCSTTTSSPSSRPSARPSPAPRPSPSSPLVQGALLLSGASGNAFLWGLCLEQPLFGIAYYIVHRVTGGLPVSRWRLDLTYGISLLSRSIRLNLSAVFGAIVVPHPGHPAGPLRGGRHRRPVGRSERAGRALVRAVERAGRHAVPRLVASARVGHGASSTS